MAAGPASTNDRHRWTLQHAGISLAVYQQGRIRNAAKHCGQVSRYGGLQRDITGLKVGLARLYLLSYPASSTWGRGRKSSQGAGMLFQQAPYPDPAIAFQEQRQRHGVRLEVCTATGIHRAQYAKRPDRALAEMEEVSGAMSTR